MEEIEMDNFDENEIESYTREQLNDYYNNIYTERNKLYNRYGDNDNTPEDIRVKYANYDSILNKIEEQRDVLAERSFIDSHDGKTVKITGPGGEIDAPSANFSTRFNKQVTWDKKANIKKVLGMDYEFRKGDGKNSRDLIENTMPIFSKEGKLLGLEYKGERVYVSRDLGKTFTRTTNKKHQNAFKYFDSLVEKAVDEHNETEELRSNMGLINTEPDNNFIGGLTDEENRELEGVLNPPENIDKSTRPLFLKEQSDHFQETIDGTKKLLAEESIDEFELNERIIALEEARDRTLEQMEREEVRSQQEEDISRFQRFKEWAKENLLGLSALAVAIGGITTAVVVSARSVIYKGAAGVNKLSKAVYNFFSGLAKTLGPIIGPILSAIGSILSVILKYGAKGIEWLSKNLWALVVGIVIIIYERYRKK